MEFNILNKILNSDQPDKSIRDTLKVELVFKNELDKELDYVKIPFLIYDFSGMEYLYIEFIQHLVACVNLHTLNWEVSETMSPGKYINSLPGELESLNIFTSMSKTINSGHYDDIELPMEFYMRDMYKRDLCKELGLYYEIPIVQGWYLPYHEVMFSYYNEEGVEYLLTIGNSI